MHDGMIFFSVTGKILIIGKVLNLLSYIDSIYLK